MNVSGRGAAARSSKAGRVRSLYLVLELSQEERQQVLDRVVLAQDGRKAHDDRGQRRLHMLIGVRNEFLFRDGTQRGDQRPDNQVVRTGGMQLKL